MAVPDTGISALLHDQAGIPDTCQRKNLSGQYAGSVLRDLYHRIVLLYDNAVVFLSEKVYRYQNSVAVAVKLSKIIPETVDIAYRFLYYIDNRYIDNLYNGR